jgi:hypothetical protein
MSSKANDLLIQSLLREGRLVVDRESGQVFAPKSNTPQKPIGCASRKGYLRTSIFMQGMPKCLMVHRVVCIAVHGLPKSGYFVNHKNGNKMDNAPENLEWVTSVFDA